MVRVPSVEGASETVRTRPRRRRKLTFFSGEVSLNNISGNFEKRLAERVAIRTVSLPFDWVRWKKIWWDK
jgi:hypothetical protein